MFLTVLFNKVMLFGRSSAGIYLKWNIIFSKVPFGYLKRIYYSACIRYHNCSLPVFYYNWFNSCNYVLFEMGKHKNKSKEKKLKNPLETIKKHVSTSKVKNGGNRMNMVLYKKHGQHLLKNSGILDKIIQAAKIKRSDIVLEIGCGTGNLTVRLLPLAKKVITIDIDSRMISEVKKRCLYEGYSNLEVYEGDAIKTVFPKFDICTANIPYKISSPLVFKLIAHRPPFKCAVLMFQKEFAERMLAKVGESKYSRLSINVKLFCKVIRVCNVDRNSFNPPPNVDSVVVKIIPKDMNVQMNFDEWDNLLRICFTRKRKTLHAIFKRNAVLNMLEHNYKTWCSINKQEPIVTNFKTYCLQVLKDLEMEQMRSINLDVADFLKLLIEFNKRNIYFCNISNVKGDVYSIGLFDGEDGEEDHDNTDNE